MLGTTRWTVHTAGYEVDLLRTGGLRLRPLLELSYGRIRGVGGGLFDVETLYGQDHFWSMSVGLRVGAGTPVHRMGRYGSMDEADMSHHHAMGVE